MEEIIVKIFEHIATLNDDYTALKDGYTTLSVDVGILKSQVSDLIWYFRAGMGSLIVLMVSQFWQVMRIYKNGKK